jgi:ribosomal protein S24E
VIELIHPELSNVSKTDIKSKLAQTLKTKDENISIFGLKTKFGGGRSTGFALIYDSLDARKKFDSKKMLRRVSLTSQRCFCAPNIA